MKDLLFKVVMMVAVLLSCLPASAYDFEADDIFYNINDDNTSVSVTYRNTNYDTYIGDVVIPSQVVNNGICYTVTQIGERAFMKSSGVTSISIPSSITKIGLYSFQEANHIRKVFISDLSAWCMIDFDSFYSSPLVYGATLLLENEPISTLSELDSTCSRIGKYAFYGNIYFRNVVIPDGVVEVDDAAFSGCTNMEYLEIGSDVVSMGEGVFRNCSKLDTIKFVDSSKTLNLGRYEYGKLYRYFKDCPLTTVYVGRLIEWGDDGVNDSYYYPFNTVSTAIFNVNTTGMASGFTSLVNVYIGPKCHEFSIYKSALTNLYIFNNEIDRAYIDSKKTNIYVLDKTNIPSKIEALQYLKSFNLLEWENISNNQSYEYGSFPEIDSSQILSYVPYMAVQLDGAIINHNVGYHDSGIPVNLHNSLWNVTIKLPLNYTITPASLTVIANDAHREYKQENPNFSCTYVGFKDNETEEVLTDKPTLTTTANLNSIPGTYPIIPSSASAQNYTFSYERGTLTVTKAKNQLTWDQHIPAMEIGDNFALGFDVYEVTGEPSFSQYDSSVISIYKDGETWYVKALAPGTTNLAIQYVGNDYYETSNLVSKTITVNKAPDVPAESISLNKTSLSLTIGTFETLTAMMSPDNTTDKTVVWDSNDESIAKVSSEGSVMAVGLGTTYITATCGDAKATCAVTVLPVSATNVFLDKTSLDLLVDDTYILRASVIPEGTTDKTVLWSTSNETVASVSSEGLVSAVGAGTAEVTARCGDATAKCLVAVNKHLQSITWTQDLSNVKDGEDFELTATASSGLPVEYEIRTGLNIASIKDDILLSTSHGEISVAAAQRGDDKYAEAEEVVRTIVIQQTSGISLVNSDDKYVRIEGSSILTSGNIEIVVYEINGNLLYKGKDHVVKLQPQTIYILTYEGNSVKFVAR